MESKQLGLQDYNDAILSVYGANPVVQMSGSSGEDDGAGTKELTGDPPTKKERRIKKGTLFTETLKLKKAALLNLSLANRIFEYEQMRLKQLTVELLEAEPRRKKSETDSKKKKEEEEEDKKLFSGKWLKDLFRRIKVDIKRRLGPRGRRQFRAVRKRLLRKVTRPIRQTRRFLNKQFRKLGVGARRAIGLRGRKLLKSAGKLARASKVIAKRRLGLQNRKLGKLIQNRGLGKVISTFKERKLRNLGKPLRQTKRFLSKQAGKGLKYVGSKAVGAMGSAGSKVVKGISGLGKGASGIAKNLKGVGKVAKSGPLAALFAGIELKGRKDAGQTDLQAGVGTAASTAGGVAGAAGGAQAGAALGAAIGVWFGGVGAVPGAAIGGLIGGIAGGFAGSYGASKASDALTGVKAENEYAEGGKVTGPQLALIGEGGEPEFVVPQSKLAYFLSGPTGIGLINAGAKTIFGGVRKFADAIGLDSKILNSIPEFNLEKQLPDTDIKVPTPITGVKEPPKVPNIGSSIIQKIIDGFKNLIKDLPSLITGPLGSLINGALSIGKGLTNLTDGLGLTDGDEKSASPYLTSGGEGPDAYVYSKFRSANRPGHNGVDYSGGPFSKVGTPISVIMPGVVEHTGNDPTGWGNYVVIKHTNGRYSLYGHLNSINVGKGQKLEPDASGNAPVIGTLGSTGRSEGPHLHFEMGSGWNGRIQNHINPEPHAKSYFRAGGTKVTKKPDPKGTDAPKVSGAGNLAGNLIPTPPRMGGGLALPSPYQLNTMGSSITQTPELPFANAGTTQLLNGGGIQYVPVPVPVPTGSGKVKPSSIYSAWGATPQK